MTILHIAQPVDGGVARVLVDLVRGQREAGHRVLVACPGGGRLEPEAAAAGALVRDWPARRSPGPATAAEAWRLRRIVRDAQPDVLHLHSAKAGLAGRLAVRGAVPTVFQPHAWSFAAVDGPLAAATLRWERYAARWADRVLCVSEQERRDGEAAGVRARWTVVPNGVDVRHHTPADRRAARMSLGLDLEAPLAVCVGRLCRQKGQDVLLAAWPQVLARVPAARLALVGGGPDEALLAATVRELAEPFRVRAAGDVPDPRPWLAAADLVVLPSRWEGMALAPLEAMAAGRPVLLTDVPGARECLPPSERAGGTVPAEDPLALATGIARALADPIECERRGAAARAHVTARHDVRAVVEQVEELYRTVVRADRAGRTAGRGGDRVPGRI
ncbi:glycosyl transferase family 1 [Kitasatospora herbaricolor]|uniref:glycosyltransferase n=1 Tax=Kitasatospora herbaricolor TaxID=68217 RepID=UPI0017490269|nr:glycosyltransferase [Kitasatospora herbaricolor]MDQ0311213.1 glycosyltransferase involved in cell wall biosynthesis [Kitasatospora herbaricolor]GGV11310.1 glycosyl transferase family 1 [Kitasatospora herbaricolor]